MLRPIRSLLLAQNDAVAAILLGGALALIGAWLRPVDSLLTAILSVALAWASIVDLRRLVLPDLLTLGLVVIGLSSALIARGSFLSCLAGAALGYSLVWLVNWWFSAVRKRQGIGMGDAKLFAAVGAWTGLQALPAVVLIASLAGILVFVGDALWRRRFERNIPLPFGPFIAAAFWATWVFGLANSN